MESEQLPLIEVPHSIVPGSVPLSNARREEFAQWWAAGIPPRTAGEKVGLGYDLRGTISKWTNNRKIIARVQYLRGNRDEAIRRKHEFAESILVNIMSSPIAEYLLPGTKSLQLDMERLTALKNDNPDEYRELMATVKSSSVSKDGGKVELLSVLEATSQYRAINGLDAPKRVEMSGPEGGPIETQDVSARERIASRLARLAAPAAASGDT